jgi:hypothetical protein
MPGGCDIFDPFKAEDRHAGIGLAPGDIYWRTREKVQVDGECKYLIAACTPCECGDLRGAVLGSHEFGGTMLDAAPDVDTGDIILHAQHEALGGIWCSFSGYPIPPAERRPGVNGLYWPRFVQFEFPHMIVSPQGHIMAWSHWFYGSSGAGLLQSIETPRVLTLQGRCVRYSFPQGGTVLGIGYTVLNYRNQDGDLVGHRAQDAFYMLGQSDGNNVAFGTWGPETIGWNTSVHMWGGHDSRTDEGAIGWRMSHPVAVLAPDGYVRWDDTLELTTTVETSSPCTAKIIAGPVETMPAIARDNGAVHREYLAANYTTLGSWSYYDPYYEQTYWARWVTGY